MAITFKGIPISLAGHFVKEGNNAPDFTLIQTDLTDFSLKENRGSCFILNIFPSLDTSLCATSVRKFNKMAASLPNVKVLCISKDLPFAHNRFCVTEGIDNVIALSDYRYDSDFGHKYGLLMTNGPLKGLLARAVVVINPEGKVIYTQLVPEITHEPDYEAVLQAIK